MVYIYYCFNTFPCNSLPLSSYLSKNPKSKALMASNHDTGQEESVTNMIIRPRLSNLNPNLPQELLVEILSRLSVKSLLQCRSVSRSWRSLISSPEFAKTHFKKSSENHQFAYHRLILSSTRPHFDLRTCSLYSVIQERSVNAVEIDYPLKCPFASVWIVGSCNGLLCLAVEEDIVFIWNPTTRKSMSLPGSFSNLPTARYVIYGFGYDESRDEYVVLGIFCCFRTGNKYEAEVKIFKSRSGSWRKIEDFPYSIPLDDSGKFSNGAIHWAASTNFSSDSASAWIIIAFDISTETYRKVEKPDYGEGDFDITLGVLADLLCVVCNHKGDHADVWVMKEYNVRESWTKIVSIPYLTDAKIRRYSTPLWMGKNGDVLLEVGSQLVRYNFREDSFNHFQLHNFVPCLEAHAYVESLTSPNPSVQYPNKGKVELEQGQVC